MSILAEQYARIATGHARKALAAGLDGNNAESAHWWAESDRFDALYRLALVDEAAARAQYRPTRNYES